MYSAVLYDEIDIFAALVLFVILDRSGRRLLSLDQRIFNAELLSVICVLLLDAATWTLNCQTFAGARTLNLVFSYLYWFSTMFPCFIGMLYCFYVVYGRIERKLTLLFTLPIAAGAVLLVCNLRTGWIFTVSDENVYARGPYFLAVGLLPFIHMAAAVLVTLKKYLSVASYDRRRYFMLALFMAAPLIGSLLQIFFYGLVTIWIGLTLTDLMCYVYIQRGNLATDPLTGVNNRRRFDSYSTWKWQELRAGQTLWLVMLDIDKFKTINDTYGHAEGDAALVRAADVLKHALTGVKNSFLARIGGDEFAILLDNADETAVQALCECIRALMETDSAVSGRPYRLSFSIGYAGIHGEEKPDFRILFAQADQKMYEVKRARTDDAGQRVPSAAPVPAAAKAGR